MKCGGIRPILNLITVKVYQQWRNLPSWAPRPTCSTEWDEPSRGRCTWGTWRKRMRQYSILQCSAYPSQSRTRRRWAERRETILSSHSRTGTRAVLFSTGKRRPKEKINKLDGRKKVTNYSDSNPLPFVFLLKTQQKKSSVDTYRVTRLLFLIVFFPFFHGRFRFWIWKIEYLCKFT